MNQIVDTTPLLADTFSLYLAFAAAMVATFAYFFYGFRREEWLGSIARSSYFVCVGAVAYATLYLFQQILSKSRYDIAYIYRHSSPNDELIYRISALWAGQEGSLLFWALLAALVGLALVRFIGVRSPFAMSFWSSVMVFFLTVLVVSNPFERLAGYHPGVVGTGLNPLLKNPWMAIHPPIVFLGYAGLSVPAAFAIAALIRRDDRTWAIQCLPWALFGWVALSAGIILGMVWAYEVLGWGGYWSWDPVENASLIPWLTSTALLHGLILQRYRGRMIRTNVILALLTFLLVIYATFLTRSGVLANVSVHSFAETNAYVWLLGFLIFYALLSILLVVGYWKSIPKVSKPMRPDSKDFAMAISVAVMVAFAVVVMVGTSWPVIQGFLNAAGHATRGNAAEQGSVINASFYNRMSVPIVIAVVVLMALTPLLRWRGEEDSSGSSDEKKARRSQKNVAVGRVAKVLVAMGAIAIVAGVIAIVKPSLAYGIFGWLVSPENPRYAVAVQMLLFAVGASVVALFVSLTFLLRAAPIRIGAYLSHAGVALLILGVIFSAAGESKMLELEHNGTPGKAFGYKISYEGRKEVKPGKEKLVLQVDRAGRSFEAPLYVESTSRGTLRTPYIHSPFLSDLYISPSEVQVAAITPTVSITEDGWYALPEKVPGSNATLSLAGIKAEAHSVLLEYSEPGEKPVEVVVTEGEPAKMGEYTFHFDRFVGTEGNMPTMSTVGVRLNVTGPGITEKAIVEVGTKPFIGLLWMGCGLILLGGIVAMVRRASESRRLKSGVLSNSPGSDS